MGKLTSASVLPTCRKRPAGTAKPATTPSAERKAAESTVRALGSVATGSRLLRAGPATLRRYATEAGDFRKWYRDKHGLSPNGELVDRQLELYIDELRRKNIQISKARDALAGYCLLFCQCHPRDQSFFGAVGAALEGWMKRDHSNARKP